LERGEVLEKAYAQDQTEAGVSLYRVFTVSKGKQDKSCSRGGREGRAHSRQLWTKIEERGGIKVDYEREKGTLLNKKK